MYKYKKQKLMKKRKIYMTKKNIERNLQVAINQGFSNEKIIWRRRFTAFNT